MMKTYIIDCGHREVPFHVEASMYEGILTFVVTRTRNDGEVVEHEEVSTTTVVLSDLLSRSDASDFALYPIDMNGALPNNSTALSLAGKQSLPEYAVANRLIIVGGITVQAIKDPNTTSLFLCEYNGNTVKTNGDLEVQLEKLNTYSPLFQTLKITNIVKNGDLYEVLLSSSCVSPQTAYLETTVGVLLTPRVELVNGSGSAYLSVAGLPSGIVGKVKAGFKYFTGLTEMGLTL